MSKWVSMKELFEVLTQDMSAADVKSAMVISDIALAILKERVNRNMTQKQFAKFLGVSQGMVSKWESGDYNFTISSIANVFEKLEMDFEFKILQKTDEFIDIDDSEVIDDMKVSLKTEKNPKLRIFNEELFLAS